MWSRWRLFWNEGLWNFRLADVECGWSRRYFACLRIVALSIRGFFANRCTLRASSLTYYTLMSIVPILTISFAIARGFGFQESLREDILEQFQDQQTAVFELISFAEKLLEETRGGIIAGIGVAILFWSAVQLLGSIEDAFNQIWDARKKRSWRFLISEYLAWLVIGPLFFVLSNSSAVYIIRHIEMWTDLFPLLVLIRLLPYAIFWFFFSFLYYFFPNAKVRYASAFLGGIIAGTLYFILQWGYIHFQIGVSRYGAVYGSFAALPLFLIWIQVSWFLLLFGAEVSYAHQTLEMHEFEAAVRKSAPSFRRMASLWVLQLAIQRFRETGHPLSLAWLLREKSIPASLAIPLLQQLCDAKLLIELNEKREYLPGRDAERLRISDVLAALDSQGSELPFLRSNQLAPFERAFQSFQDAIEKSGENRCLSEM